MVSSSVSRISVLSHWRPGHSTGVLRVCCVHIAYVGMQCRLEMSAEWYIAWTETHENGSVLGLNAGLRRAVVETSRRSLAATGARCRSHGTEICVAGKWQWGRFVCGTVHFLFQTNFLAAFLHIYLSTGAVSIWVIWGRWAKGFGVMTLWSGEEQKKRRKMKERKQRED